ncbi:hypothetical protein RHG63_06180 [Clostridioides difficile]|nr:hypothetical protein [Clostridioides difficile]
MGMIGCYTKISEENVFNYSNQKKIYKILFLKMPTKIVLSILIKHGMPFTLL